MPFSKSVDSTETLLKYGYSPDSLNDSSHKFVVAVCEFCGKRYETQFRRAKGVCKKCNSVASSYTMNSKNVTKKQFYDSTVGNVSEKIASIIPCGMSPFSSKRVNVYCEFCGNQYGTTPNTLSKSGSATCKRCIGVATLHKEEDGDKRSFYLKMVENNSKKLKPIVDRINVELTMKEFGNEVSTMKWWSHDKVMTSCYFCGLPNSTSMIYLVKNGGIVSCPSCVGKKTTKTIFERYGVESVTDVPSVKAKLSNPSTERLVESVLSGYGVSFTRNYTIGPYSFDFFLPSHKVLIECQGDFFHGFKTNGYNGTSKDAAKATYVNRHTEFELVSIWEHEIHIGRIRTILRRFIRENVLKFELRDLNVSRINSDDAKNFLAQYHYLGSLKSAQHFGAMVGSQIVAVGSFGPTTRQTTGPKLSKHMSVPIKHGEIMELRRFCIISGDHPKNMASYLLKRFVKAAVKTNTKIVMGFSDSSVGHSGGVYKAAGWNELWTTSTSYHYLDPKTNKSIHKKTVYERASNLKMKESEFVEKTGLIKVKESPKVAWAKVIQI